MAKGVDNSWTGTIIHLKAKRCRCRKLLLEIAEEDLELGKEQLSKDIAGYWIKRTSEGYFKEINASSRIVYKTIKQTKTWLQMGIVCKFFIEFKPLIYRKTSKSYGCLFIPGQANVLGKLCSNQIFQISRLSVCRHDVCCISLLQKCAVLLIASWEVFGKVDCLAIRETWLFGENQGETTRISFWLPVLLQLLVSTNNFTTSKL